MSARFPSDDRVEARIGTWETIAGQNPDADDLLDRALELLGNDELVNERLVQQSVRYTWRRQKLPHGKTWKQAEEACQRLLDDVQNGGAGQ